MDSVSPIGALLELMLEVITWFSSAVSAVVPIFWADNEFTFVGAITGVGVAIGFTLLVVAMIRSLIRFQ